MTCLDYEDGASNYQVLGVSNVSCRTEIGRDTNAFEDGCQSNEAFGIGEWELISCLVYGCGRDCVDSICEEGKRLDKSSKEQRRKHYHLIIVDLLQVVVEWVGEPSIDEILPAKLGEALHVELPLEVFESQCIVQDGEVASRNGVGTLLNWSCGNKAGTSSNGCKDGNGTHGDEWTSFVWTKLYGHNKCRYG